MSTPADVLHLYGIIEGIGLVRQYVGAGRPAFDAEPMRRDAVVYRLAVIGEAAGRLSPGLKWQVPHLKQIVRMRNILVHDYHAIDLDVVWETAAHNLDELEDLAASLLSAELL